MPLRFPRIRTIRATGPWQKALTSENFGNPNLCEYDEMFEIMQRVRRWSLRSPTAQSILKYLDDSSTIINVIGMKSGGYTCFDSECPLPNAGTCFVDVEAQFAVASTGEPLHNYIALLHELGHAKQWVENPGWFRTAGNNTAQVRYQDLQTKLIDFAVARAAPAVAVVAPAPGAAFGDGPPPPPAMGAAVNRVAIGQAVRNRLNIPGNFSQTHAKWPFVIEQDNMARHEWPICDEARYPRRAGYADLAVTLPNA